MQARTTDAACIQRRVLPSGGDDPTTPVRSSNMDGLRDPTDNSAGPQLGEELWGFIPYEFLPQLQWLTSPTTSMCTT